MQISLATHEPHVGEQVFNTLRDYNDTFNPKVNYEPFIIKAEENGKFLGGVDGFQAWDFLEIGNLVVTENERGKGLGGKLLAFVEDYAKAKNLKKIVLSTMAFQAPDFYKKYGFVEFGRIEHAAGEHTCFYMVKELTHA